MSIHGLIISTTNLPPRLSGPARHTRHGVVPTYHLRSGEDGVHPKILEKFCPSPVPGGHQSGLSSTSRARLPGQRRVRRGSLVLGGISRGALHTVELRIEGPILWRQQGHRGLGVEHPLSGAAESSDDQGFAQRRPWQVFCRGDGFGGAWIGY